MKLQLGLMTSVATFALAQPALAQWNANNPIESAPAKDKIPPYVKHGTYLANKAPLPGPIEVGYNYHLPPDYDGGIRRYPLIVQLGGHTDDESKGLVDRGLPNRYQEKMLDGTIRPVVSIYVNGPGTLPSYVDLEATIIEELLPHVDQTFRTLTERECRHIEGYSRGGSGAPLFAFRYPDLFSAAVSNAGSSTEGIEQALPGLKAEALAQGVRLLVTILEGDHLFEANVGFRDFLQAEGVPFDFSSAPGGSHDTNLYFNDPETYDEIGYGNIIWHEKAFREQGCEEPSGGGAGGGGAGAGGNAGSGGMPTAGDSAGAAGSLAASSGSGSMLSGGGAAAVPPPTSEPPASRTSSLSCAHARAPSEAPSLAALLIASSSLLRRRRGSKLAP
jgi:hypothetical protein